MSKREDKDLQRKTIISIVQIFLLAVSLQIIFVQSKRFEEKMPISQLLQTVCWLISGGYLLCIILIYYSFNVAQFLMIEENIVWEHFQSCVKLTNSHLVNMLSYGQYFFIEKRLT